MKPSTLGVAWLISKLAWRRLANRFTRRARNGGLGVRAATARKSSPGKLLLGLMALAFAFQGVSITTRVVEQASRRAEQAEAPDTIFIDEMTFFALEESYEHGACDPVHPDRDWREQALASLRSEHVRVADELAERRAVLVQRFEAHCLRDFRPSKVTAHFWPSPELWYPARDPLALPRTLGVFATLLCFGLALQTLAGAGNDLTSVDARLEFLFAFPVRARGLFLARILALAFTVPSLWVIALPFFAVVFFCAGFGVLGVLLGVLATLHVGLLAGAARIVLETTLPRVLSPTMLARCQAVLTLAAYVAMLSSLGYTLRFAQNGATGHFLTLPAWALFTPFSAPLAVAGHRLHAVAGVLSSAAFAIVFVGGAVLVAERAVRDGFVVSSGALQGARGTRLPSAGGRGWLAGGAGKELKALFRDRQLRMQAFVIPVAIVALQIWLNPSLLAHVLGSAASVATAAFATSMFTLTTGACSLLATEGSALWLLYTVPVSLERVLASKLCVWIGVASLFASAALAGLWWHRPELVVPTLPYVPLVFVGIGLYALIAMGIGALGTDPLETEQRRRVRPGAIYLFMLLAGLFGYAIWAPSLWGKLVEVALSALLAYALWQKLRDQLPFLLDPTEAPPPALSVADGVLAALGFFVLQSVFAWLFGAEGRALAEQIALAFGAAGLTVAVLALAYYRSARLPRLLETLGLRRPKATRTTLSALAAGVFAGLGAALAAVLYLHVLQQFDWGRRLLEGHKSFEQVLDDPSHVWLALVVVVAAPLFEEFIFRGILFAGLRRSLPVSTAAFASAAVFALVHPAVAAPAVFTMAVLAALVYERSGWLGGPIAVHMTYNAVVMTQHLH